MKSEATVLLLCIFTLKTAFSSWSSQIHSMFKTKATKGLTQFSPSKELMNSIEFGTHLAVEQCRETFTFDRWNCPESIFSTRYKHPFSKEIAYAQAIRAAGIVHAITKSCSNGTIIGCGCDPNLHGPINTTLSHVEPTMMLSEKGDKIDLAWGGCSDNTAFAENVAKYILNSLEGGNDAQAYSSRHNNFIGRKMVRNSMVRQCKCQGIPGMCFMQTCWMELAPFQQIAQSLKRLYRNAVKINFESAPFGITIGNSVKNSGEEIKRIKRDALVFVDKSPNFCRQHRLIGWPGVKGRSCSKSESTTDLSEKKSCRDICRACGFKVRKHIREVSERCNCTFVFCCEVKCDTCTKTVETYYCG